MPDSCLCGGKDEVLPSRVEKKLPPVISEQCETAVSICCLAGLKFELNFNVSELIGQFKFNLPGVQHYNIINSGS